MSNNINSGNITQTPRRVKRLSEEEKEFLRIYGALIQKFNVPKVAKMFGVTRQAIEQHIHKYEKENEKA